LPVHAFVGPVTLPLMHEHFSDLLGTATERSVTVKAPDGHSLVEAKLLHAIIAAAVGIVVAPRLTAAAAVAALLKGFRVDMTDTAGESAAA